MRDDELLCQLPSEGIGGTYQSATPYSIVNVSQKTRHHLIRMYGEPPLDSDFVFIDIGCAQNRPMWLAAVLFGFRTIGIEVDTLRARAAAITALDMMKNKIAVNSQVAFIQADAAKPLSFAGIHAFFIWNEAFPFKLTWAILDSIANSLDHPSLEGKQRKGRLPKALIIIGMKRMRRVLELFDERFCYKEVGHVDITLRVIGTKNRLKFFEVELRSDYVPTPAPEDSSVLERAKPFFKSANARKREYERVIVEVSGSLSSDSCGVMTRTRQAAQRQRKY